MINLTADEFLEDDGYFYSPSFKQDDKDTLLSIGVLLEGSGEVSLQSSTDEIKWVDIANSSFTCSPFGLQTFCNGHHLLYYRIITTYQVVYAQILI